MERGGAFDTVSEANTQAENNPMHDSPEGPALCLLFPAKHLMRQAEPGWRSAGTPPCPNPAPCFCNHFR